MHGDYGQELGDISNCDYLVSACMAGYCCRFDGDTRPVQEIVDLCKHGKAYPVCPEELGGLPVPRLPAEIVGGSGEDVLDGTATVLDGKGNDVTNCFVSGAYRALAIARRIGVTKATMKSRSPSCSAGSIYRAGVLVGGNGVCAAVLKRAGFVVTER